MRRIFTPISANKAIRLTCAAAAMAFMSSCTVMLPVSATSNPVGGSKVGTSTATSFLGFWINPDASIRTAAANGHITKISTVDVESTNFLFIIHTYKTKVIGD